MTHAKVCLFVATALLFGSVAGAHAQGTADSMTNRSTGVERNATSGGNCDNWNWREDRARPVIAANSSRSEHVKSPAKSSAPSQYMGPDANESTRASVWVTINPIRRRQI